jgi:hypothetical protein
MCFLPQKIAETPVFCTLNSKKCTFWPKTHIKNWQKLKKLPCFVPGVVQPGSTNSKLFKDIWGINF